MAAVRCAARRLGGSLLQRTQSAVAEEGRLLAPSRLVRSRHLSSKRSQVAEPERYLLEPGWLMRNRQLASEITKNLESPALDSEVQLMLESLSAECDRLEELQKKTAPEPDAFELGARAYGRAAKAVISGAAKTLFAFSMITSLIFGGNGARAQALTNENQ